MASGWLPPVEGDSVELSPLPFTPSKFVSGLNAPSSEPEFELQPGDSETGDELNAIKATQCQDSLAAETVRDTAWSPRAVRMLRAVKREEWENMAVAGCRRKTKLRSDMSGEAEVGILKSRKSCRNKLDDLFQERKLVGGHQNTIPSRCSGYWKMAGKKKRSKKLSGKVDSEDCYENGAVFMGASRATNNPLTVFDNKEAFKNTDDSSEDEQPSPERKRERSLATEDLCVILKAISNQSNIVAREISEAQIKTALEVAAIAANSRRAAEELRTKRFTDMLDSARQGQELMCSAINMLVMAVSGKSQP